MPDLLSQTNCRHLATALYHQRPLITKEAEEKLEASDNFITRKIPDRGVTELSANDDDVQFRTAHQPFAAYRPIAVGPDDKVSGTMPGRACDGTRAAITTLIDTFDPNACHGTRTWNFAHGYAIKTTEDYEDAVMTDVICVENYAHFTRNRVKALFTALRSSFAKHGVDNFEANLRKLVIEKGESNFSFVGSANHEAYTTNGWEAPPDRMLDIARLDKARRYWLGLEKSTIRTERDVIEVEVDRASWFAAVLADQIRTGGPSVDFTLKYYEDPRASFYGRAFHEYKNIRAVFNDEPMKGYFRPTGASTYEFVEVLPTRNVPGANLAGASEGAGLVEERNPDYWANETTCNGVTYKLVALGWMLSPQAFERWRLMPSVSPDGVNPLGTNFEVDLLSGAYIDCNEKKNKFRYIMQHKFRFKVKEPQLAGAFVYIPEPAALGYVRMPCYDTSEDTAPDTAATYNTLEARQPDLCEQSTCETCEPGTVANGLGACVADADGVFTLVPCGAVETVGENTLLFKVFRTGNLTSAATVDYATANGTATAGTNYTAASGTLSWAADEGGYKTISVAITDPHETTDQTFTLTISNATGGASTGDCTVSTVTILADGEA